ncbi:MAG: hypothetical protein COA78_01790 [Blastopirellula sp.]|nr:MAG: hypothetical protein COA78_01790 [Blastopirellula sp.]
MSVLSQFIYSSSALSLIGQASVFSGGRTMIGLLGLGLLVIFGLVAAIVVVAVIAVVATKKQG